MRFTCFCCYVFICFFFHDTINGILKASETDNFIHPFEKIHSVMGWSKKIQSDYPIEETLTDAASITLARANPIYCNVGRLYLRSGKRQNGNGAAVYLGGVTCVTAAHCLVDEQDKFCELFDIYFQLNDGRIVQYEIEKAIVHPLYVRNKWYDIAVLKLKKPVVELIGAFVNYAYGKKERIIKKPPEVTFVGYCRAYSDLGYRHQCDFKRRATKSLLFCVGVDPLKMSAIPHTLDIVEQRTPSLMNCFSKVSFVSRPAMPYELGVKSGMSGGGAFERNELIGIHVAYIDDHMSWFNHRITKNIPILDSWLDCFRECCAIPHLRLPENMYEGQVPVSVPLGAVEDWLEGYRQEFDGEFNC